MRPHTPEWLTFTIESLRKWASLLTRQPGSLFPLKAQGNKPPSSHNDQCDPKHQNGTFSVLKAQGNELLSSHTAMAYFSVEK